MIRLKSATSTTSSRERLRIIREMLLLSEEMENASRMTIPTHLVRKIKQQDLRRMCLKGRDEDGWMEEENEYEGEENT